MTNGDLSDFLIITGNIVWLLLIVLWVNISKPGQIEKPNQVLLIVGLSLLVVATSVAFAHENAALGGSFLFFGVVTVIIGVFEPRIEGKFEFGRDKISFTVGSRRLVSKAEIETAEGGLTALGEVV